ncbi:carboxymuconolactone decarboxylase family protein [Deinococcus fonticola]|uniref:carboxymuconolactone decarboxylase family protein n=1 Tax=Deinococcus fonticola TaxID=2528713 RepID=UPI0010757F53|nr:carboxymuconolactone decarboxylase family protein [Deinococcus fonticola]
MAQDKQDRGAGQKAREVIFGSQQERILERLQGLDSDLMAYIRDFAYDTVYERPGLDLKTKELMACVLLTSLGSPPELRTHLRGAMNAGASEQEVREVLLFCVPYLGFPRTLAAFEQLRGLLEHRERKVVHVKTSHPQGQEVEESTAEDQ